MKRKCRVRVSQFAAVLGHAAVTLVAAAAGAQRSHTPGGARSVVSPTIPPAGIVWTVRGEWRVDGPDTGRLVRGRTLRRGAIIRPGPSPQPSHAITVLLADGMPIQRTCSLEGQCGPPLVLGAAPPPPASSLARVVRAVWARYQAAPQRYEPMISRGAADASSVREGVVLLRDGRVDLRPVIDSGVQQGSMALLMSRLRTRPDSPASASDGLKAIRWDLRTQSATGDSGLVPGLYMFSDANGDGAPASSAWVLVTNEEQYGPLAAAFRNASEIVARWGPEHGDEGRTFLRAYLDHLASGPAQDDASLSPPQRPRTARP